MAPVLICLLLLTQVTTTTGLRSQLQAPARQTEQLHPDDSCPTNEYWATDHCCKYCPAGEHVQKPCTDPHTTGNCKKCDPGTFTAYSNGLSSCLPCTVCRNDQEMVSQCSVTSDRTCQCRAGNFYHDSGSYEFCSSCTKCPPEFPVLQECNATADTVCNLAGSVHKRLLWIPVSFVIGIGIGIIYFRRKVMSWTQNLWNITRDKLQVSGRN